MFNKRTFFQIILICMPFIIGAQFPVYTPFSASPMNINPGFNGIFQEKYRFSLQYMNQGFNYLQNKSYQDLFFEGEMRFNAFEKDSWALGLHLDDSKAGSAGYHIGNANINAAYLKKIASNRRTNGSHYLSIGTQVGMGQRKIIGNEFILPGDIDQETGETMLPGSGDNWTGLNRKYVNLHTGLVYYYIVKDKYNITLGIAAENLNQPEISLLEGGKHTQNIKWNASLSGAMYLKNSFSVHPSFIYQNQGTFSTMLSGISFGVDFSNSSEFSLLSGLWYRSFSSENKWNVGSGSVTTILGFEKLKIGLAVNFSLNEIRVLDNGYRSLEISMIYAMGELKNKNTILCPKM